MTIIQFFVGQAMFQPIANDPAAFANDPGTALGGILTSPFGIISSVVNVLVYTATIAIIAVALHRTILFGERRPGDFFNLSFGRTEWLFMAALATAWAACLLSFAAIFYLMPAWLFVLLTLFLLAMVIYLWVRLSLIFPIAVVEGRYDFHQARALTRGRFWRLFGLWLVVTGPLYFLNSHLSNLVVFGALSPTMEMVAASSLDGLTMMKASAVQFVVSLVWSPLGVAVLSYSYKALSGRGPDEVLRPHA
jgi:hypothetical protein